MDYRRADDELFGKYCYIDTPWIAGEKTIYRIVRSGVRSNAWYDVPVKFKDETVTHDHSEDIVFAVLDTLIDENTKIKRFALKDVEIITADRKTENSSENPNNCAEQTEPQYDFGAYADRLWKIAYERGKREALEQTEPQREGCVRCDSIPQGSGATFAELGAVAAKAIDTDFLNFLFNVINPNEMENYISMYNAQGIATDCSWK